MKHRHSSQLLMPLFGLTTVCLMTAALHRLMDGPIPLWAMCCYALERLLPETLTLWLPVLARAVLILMLVTGSSVLWRRLWQTHHFISKLQTAATHTRPARLDALWDELDRPPPVVVLATPVPLAFCYGLFRPRICLSAGLINTLKAKELKAVLLHEAHHCRHYDPLRTLLVNVLAAMFFFLPAVAEWRDMFLTSIELTADRQVIRQVGRPPLAGAMYKLLTHPQAIRLLPETLLVPGFSATQARLVQLLDDAPIATPFSPRSLLTSSLALIPGCVLLQLALF